MNEATSQTTSNPPQFNDDTTYKSEESQLQVKQRRLRQSLWDALEDLHFVKHDDTVLKQKVTLHGVLDGDDRPPQEPLLLQIASLMLDELLNETEDEGESSISKKKKNENDDENENATNRASIVDSTAENWEQVMKRWNGGAGGQGSVHRHWRNPLLLVDSSTVDEREFFWESLHAIATTVQMQRLQQRRQQQQQQQQQQQPKVSLEQQLLQVQDLSQLSQLLQDQQSSLSPQQQELIQAAWTMFECDYERRKQAMQQRVRILQESFHQKEESDDDKAKEEIGMKQATNTTAVTTSTGSNHYRTKTLEMVLKEFQKPRSTSRPIPANLTLDTATPSAVGNNDDDDAVIVEDRGGRLQEEDASSKMPTWQSDEPNPSSSSSSQKPGRGDRNTKNRNRRGGGNHGRRNK